MNYSKMIGTFKLLFNNNEITDAQIEEFIDLGTSRVERRLRTALQRKTVTVAITPEGDYPIPNDLISFIHVADDKGIIPHTSITETCRGFYVKVNTLHVFGEPETIEIHYTATFPREAVDDYLPQASAIPEVIIYSGLIYAAVTYADPRLSQFEQAFEVLVSEIQKISNELDWSGNPQMRNPYEGYI